MVYLLSLAVFVWVLGFADERTGLKHHNYRNYLIIAGAAVALIMGLRTQYTGSTDTYMYVTFFNGMKGYTNFADYYDLHLSDSKFIFSETGFYYFVYLLTRVFSDGQMLILAVSVVITICTCCFIYKNTEDVPTGLLVYVCLGLLTFNMNGMRQAMAMSICLLSYESVKKRKLLPFILIVLLAMLFHKTAICFVLVYFFPLLQQGKANIFWYLVAMMVFLFSMDWFIETFNAFTGEDYLVQSEATGSGLTVVLIYVACILFSLLMYDSLKKRELRSAFLGVVAGFIIYISRFFSNQIMERLSYYFFYFTILLIPGLISELEEQEQKVVRLLFGIFAIFLFWYRIKSSSFSTFKLFF